MAIDKSGGLGANLLVGNIEAGSCGMMQMRTPLIWVVIGALTGCTTVNDPLEDYEELMPVTSMEAPEVQSAGDRDPALVEQGRYMVELVGCPACHTEGALTGDPNFDEWLSGSDVGIAWSNPMKYEDPGIVFPSNLTPDPTTGIGQRTDEEIADAIREGLVRHGSRRMLVMPWLAYSTLSESDTAAIIAYLRSLPPVVHEVPQSVPPGSKTDEDFVHFGVYRSLP